MRGLFTRAGVDYVQWKAVSRTLLRSDFRVPLSPSGEVYPLATIRGLLTLGFVHGLLGLASAVIVVVNADTMLTLTVVLSYLAFMLVTAMLTQHAATLLAATDFLILGPRPVASRTFLAIRLTNVLFHALLITTFLAVPPVLAFTFAHGLSVVRGLAAAASIYAWAVALTLALSAGYGALLHLVGASKLQRALAYMQLVVGLCMYGGVFFAMRFFGRGAVTNVAMPPEPWPWLLPPAWFASYLPIVMGVATWEAWGRAGLSLVVVGALLAALRGRIGVGYAERLGEVPGTAMASVPGTPRRLPLFRRGEARAVALLVVAHFRHDMRVRLGVLGIMPLLVFYLVLGAESASADPFVGRSGDAVDYVALAVLLFPAVLSQHFSASDAYRASWIYGVTLAQRSKLVIALKNVAVAYFLVPFLCLVVAVYAWRYGHVGHALAHAAILGLVSHLALLGGMVLSPRLPFARPPDKMTGSAGLFAWMTFVMIGGQLLLWALPRWIYVSWTRVGALAVVLLLLTTLLGRLLAWRVRSTPS